VFVAGELSFDIYSYPKQKLEQNKNQTAGVVYSAAFDFYLSITDEFLKEGGIVNSKKHYPGQIYVERQAR